MMARPRAFEGWRPELRNVEFGVQLISVVDIRSSSLLSCRLLPGTTPIAHRHHRQIAFEPDVYTTNPEMMHELPVIHMASSVSAAAPSRVEPPLPIISTQSILRPAALRH